MYTDSVILYISKHLCLSALTHVIKTVLDQWKMEYPFSVTYSALHVTNCPFTTTEQLYLLPHKLLLTILLNDYKINIALNPHQDNPCHWLSTLLVLAFSLANASCAAFMTLWSSTSKITDMANRYINVVYSLQYNYHTCLYVSFSTRPNPRILVITKTSSKRSPTTTRAVPILSHYSVSPDHRWIPSTDNWLAAPLEGSALLWRWKQGWFVKCNASSSSFIHIR